MSAREVRTAAAVMAAASLGFSLLSGPALAQSGPSTQGVEEIIFDGTQASFDRWVHDGLGSVTLTDEGTMRTEGGLGIIWYPVRAYGNAIITFEWRDVTVGAGGNGGLFIRFPDPRALDGVVENACQQGMGLPTATTVSIACGHEIQINDHSDDDEQKTGSVYNFAPRDAEQARVVPQQMWTNYEVHTIGAEDYEVIVVRDGVEINRWTNSPGQSATRETDPSTDQRQFAQGYLGLQNHVSGEVIEYRNVRVRDLDATATVAEPAPEAPAPEAPVGTTLPVTGAGSAVAGLALLLLVRRRVGTS